MAVLTIVDEDRIISEPSQISCYLNRFGIEYAQWELLPGMDTTATPSAILAAYSEKIADVMKEGAYTKVDVIDVHRETAGLDAMLSRFSAEHWHDEDEVRFIVYGRGVYHVHPPYGGVARLEVEPGDMIRVPRGTLHWFDLCGSREIKSVRFFQDPGGWTPHYTGSTLEQKHEPVCFGQSFFPASISMPLPWPKQ